jgi:tRNA/rRNA methyltransferase
MTVPEICFILYKPAVPGNIGASARAIKTMGFSELRLIDPADHLSDEAKMLAHGSHEILENCKVYDTYDEAVADISFVICTTAKKRSAKVDYIPAPRLAQFIADKSAVTGKIAIVFGSEESGLPNEILLKANVGVTIPMATEYPSLNLSQAVMTIAYECSAGAERVEPASEESNLLDEPSAPLSIERPLPEEQKSGTKSGRQVEAPGDNTGNDRITDSPGPESYNQPQETSQQPKETWLQLQERTTEILQEAGIHPPTPLYHRIIERMSMMKASDARLAHSVTARLINLLKNKA